MKTGKFLILICIVFFQISCKKWLQVQPEDKFTEEQIYESASSIADAMNGIYLQLADNSIYGKNLTLDKLDVFAQRYNTISPSSPYYNYGNWTYTNSEVKDNILSIWSKMYTTIGNVNLFISNLNIYGALRLDSGTLHTYLGAAYGLRAYMHFDLLRLFGPVYSDATKGDTSIPYYKKFDGNLQTILPAYSVIDQIKSDIDSAEYFLAADPIIVENGTQNLNDYRFNFYAAKALKARVNLWIGNKDEALEDAKSVIAAQSHFPWTTIAKVSSASNPDRKFFTETIFNIFQDNLYNLYDQIFSPDLQSENILATGESNQVDNVYEGNQADYRYVYNWPYPSSGSLSFRTFIKYKDIPNPKQDSIYNSRYAITLIRMSEMYYIAAECESDPTQALIYLNTVRQNRGIAVDITDYSLLESELIKEYEKEFYGEGQLWYYYKHIGATTIASPNSSLGNISIESNKYVLPLPDEESIGR